MQATNIYIFLAVVLTFSIYVIKTIERLITRSLIIKGDALLQGNKYDEAEIIQHLDYIINEALSEYVLFNIKPKQISYINSKLEQEIVTELVEKIPERMSKTLMVQLSFIYNSDYIGEFLGNHIYLIVMDYVLQFNLENGVDDNTSAKK